jgi:hypothetical protein
MEKPSTQLIYTASFSFHLPLESLQDSHAFFRRSGKHFWELLYIRDCRVSATAQEIQVQNGTQTLPTLLSEIHRLKVSLDRSQTRSFEPTSNLFRRPLLPKLDRYCPALQRTASQLAKLGSDRTTRRLAGLQRSQISDR